MVFFRIEKAFDDPLKSILEPSTEMKSIHTVGWAILEMYREIEEVPKKAKQQPPTEKPARGPKIITDVR